MGKEVYYQSVHEKYLGIKTLEHTYIRRVIMAPLSGASVELYDNTADPGQTNDISAQHPDVVAKFENMANKFIFDRAASHKAREITDKQHLDKLKALGYIQ